MTKVINQQKSLKQKNKMPFAAKEEKLKQNYQLALDKIIVVEICLYFR